MHRYKISVATQTPKMASSNVQNSKIIQFTETEKQQIFILRSWFGKLHLVNQLIDWLIGH